MSGLFFCGMRWLLQRDDVGIVPYGNRAIDDRPYMGVAGDLGIKIFRRGFARRNIFL